MLFIKGLRLHGGNAGEDIEYLVVPGKRNGRKEGKFMHFYLLFSFSCLEIDQTTDRGEHKESKEKSRQYPFFG